MTETVPTAAPGRLELVRGFVNTLDVEAGTDAIEDPAGLRRWLARAGLAPAGTAVRPADLRRARALREALRAAAAANHDRAPMPPEAAAVLDAAADRADLTISVTPDRRWAARPRAGGVDGALGSLVVAMTEAMSAGTWPRLRVCASDACRWAFYDHSRAGTGKWCSMRLCGNRAKQGAWRRRRATG